MTFTLEDLRSLMAGNAAAEHISANPNAAFDELGYDSLALLEFSSKLQRQHGVKIPEDELWTLHTPKQAVDYVNSLAGEQLGD